ncbi:hypothetical protein BDV27DRAFT_165045 [Aspergillus caelatus]|uniref:DUF4419 domain-containing protein n=1 Tax=Aspergillus caelatus TaxID=61420 RepID=A0A5N7ALV5_9EURO|nr:uncharacterized protein BDV27DRAFT_165045 [Aspergillus caelatus]KAE8370904.1 hypothetical protein BDV27DRAFT_165045 [Aspergillus caelatus]
MPVTLRVANHGAEKWWKEKATTAEDLLEGTSPRDYRRSKRLVQSSFDKDQFDGTHVLQDRHISPSENGLVWAIFGAYSNHYNLVIRPEDVWFSILSQLGFYVNAHAEELRSYFVSHEGQKELTVKSAIRDFGALAIGMTEQIQENVKDPELREWIMPAFSTTTTSDKIVSAILMMGVMQKYFSYKMCLMCGIPNVTLLGERDDWVLLLSKIDKIPELGKEPTQFATLLRPVLQHFISSFDNPSSPAVVDFWQRSVHRQGGGSGPSYLSGWVTAFCFWNAQGEPLYREDTVANGLGGNLDGICYHRVETDTIPSGYNTVPVKVDDFGHVYNTKMVAGLVGIEASPTPSANGGEAGSLDTIQPVAGWWMYEIDSEAEEAREKEKRELQAEMDSIKSTSADWESDPQLSDRYWTLFSKHKDLELV